MKKNISLLIIALLLIGFSGCKNGNHDYTIFGELPVSGFDGTTVYLMDIDGADTLGSAVITDGLFQIKGTAETAQMAVLVTPATQSMHYQSIIVVEPGEIHINMMNDSLYGTPMNDLYFKSFTNDSISKNLNMQLQALMEQYSTTDDPQVQMATSQMGILLDSMLTAHFIELNQQVFSQNPDNIIGAYALCNLVNYEEMSYEELDSVMDRSNNVINQFEPLRRVRAELFHLANTSEGKPYVDIKGIDYATGEPTTLSAMLDSSKITLVDFWASWCRPCRQEISENLIRLYEKYGSQGLNIIGVDVWERNIADHKKAVEDLGITYPQLIDTTKLSTENYGINGIPTILLLDRQGTIVKRNIRGAEIEAAVVELLGIEQTAK